MDLNTFLKNLKNFYFLVKERVQSEFSDFMNKLSLGFFRISWIFHLNFEWNFHFFHFWKKWKISEGQKANFWKILILKFLKICFSLAFKKLVKKFWLILVKFLTKNFAFFGKDPQVTSFLIK